MQRFRQCKLNERQVVVKSILKDPGLYKKWTPVSTFLACGLV